MSNPAWIDALSADDLPADDVMGLVLAGRDLEALAQTGGLLCINAMPDGQYDTYFLKIDNCKFKQKVVPGDTLILKMELIEPIRRGICVMRGSVYVGNKLCTEADLTAREQLAQRRARHAERARPPQLLLCPRPGRPRLRVPPRPAAPAPVAPPAPALARRYAGLCRR